MLSFRLFSGHLLPVRGKPQSSLISKAVSLKTVLLQLIWQVLGYWSLYHVAWANCQLDSVTACCCLSCWSITTFSIMAGICTTTKWSIASLVWLSWYCWNLQFPSNSCCVLNDVIFILSSTVVIGAVVVCPSLAIASWAFASSWATASWVHAKVHGYRETVHSQSWQVRWMCATWLASPITVSIGLRFVLAVPYWPRLSTSVNTCSIFFLIGVKRFHCGQLPGLLLPGLAGPWRALWAHSGPKWATLNSNLGQTKPRVREI